jgi:cobyrinic acid a,c-diamide synthase
MERAAAVHGECGGYMVMGRGLVDARGRRHAMLGLLPLETSFARSRLTLGYRDATVLGGPFEGNVAAHEFHHATIMSEEGPSMAIAWDAEGIDLGGVGLAVGQARGSFLHLIERVPTDAGPV